MKRSTTLSLAIVTLAGCHSEGTVLDVAYGSVLGVMTDSMEVQSVAVFGVTESRLGE